MSTLGHTVMRQSRNLLVNNEAKLSDAFPLQFMLFWVETEDKEMILSDNYDK